MCQLEQRGSTEETAGPSPWQPLFNSECKASRSAFSNLAPLLQLLLLLAGVIRGGGTRKWDGAIWIVASQAWIQLDWLQRFQSPGHLPSCSVEVHTMGLLWQPSYGRLAQFLLLLGVFCCFFLSWSRWYCDRVVVGTRHRFLSHCQSLLYGGCQMSVTYSLPPMHLLSLFINNCTACQITVHWPCGNVLAELLLGTWRNWWIISPLHP